MYVNTKDILEKASKEYYAVPAFNINNMEFFHAILEGALEKRAPLSRVKLSLNQERLVLLLFNLLLTFASS